VKGIKFLLVLVLMLSLTNCGFLFYERSKGKSYVVKGRRYHILASAKGFREKGLASWYGEPFHGRQTASGEIYDMDKVSAAHKTLPLHTWVEVKNLDHKRTMAVRINDRGPFVPGRVIDLSRAAAKELGVYGPGVAKVQLRAITGRRAQQLTAAERARDGLDLLALVGPGLLAGGGEDGPRLAQGQSPAPSAGNGEDGDNP
jgi:rare lipoprotein A (peptidoglycan hydrolase)